MSNETLLSSEQALDDYFTALLLDDNDDELQAFVSADLDDSPIAEPEEDYTPQLKIQSVEEKRFYPLPTADVEVEVPNLGDVERLLQQLAASNPVEELEAIFEQNTVQIAQEIATQQHEDEIQEWNVDPYVELNLDTTIETGVTEDVEQESTIDIDVESDLETQSLEKQVHGALSQNWQSTQREQDFQVLYFDVNGVTFAVPLDELGGIHKLETLSHLIGDRKSVV